MLRFDDGTIGSISSERAADQVLSEPAYFAKRLASFGYEGWFVVEAEQDPVPNPPLEMARVGHRELIRVLAAAGFEVA